ncbi:hypothetical protein KTO58_27775 [Chitinophaga pendula]|uniref:fasciclin domain-containing protein n=1 Tax=Chitinophaga TaxID=79328 RepID=UPI000BAEC4F9|nr:MULTISPECIES: fasciclin domain-containing protein [Chitinophaga]ASZ09650.1 hypothetical protein CK934_01000 [Chitinophaga sp. MD30]UCJ07417.1 hypothetical protein KTO58_27775 [Chitinophaga pendula]
MKYYLQYGLMTWLLLSGIIGCKKVEFTLPPEGAKIPYVDPNYKTLEEVLKASPYQLFLKVYQRSNMDSVLKVKSLYTLLVPTDATMQAAGYTAAKIAAMTRENADTLVAFYTLRGSLSKEQLKMSIANRECISLLANPDPSFKVWPVRLYGLDRVYYRHYLIASEDSLLINAVPVGALKNALPAANGYIYPLDKLLPRPLEKSFWDALEEDPRFSMFIQVQQETDKMFNKRYRDKLIEAIDFDPGEFGWLDSKRTNYKPRFIMEPVFGGDRHLEITTMFAPTNEAFHRAGFNTVEDVMAWNEKYATPTIFDYDLYDILPFGFPADTVLAYHWDFGRDNVPASYLYGKNYGARPTVFYANDLRDDYLANYTVNSDPQATSYIMPFSFGRTPDGKPTVKIKGSNAAPATVIETINTIMGPIHVVDRLLIPNNYKMK